MCDSLSGYLMNFKMYTGSLLADDRNDVVSIVKQLLEPIADRQPHVCCDRGYTSGNDIDLVLAMNGELVGTIAANRFSKCFVPIPEGETQVVKFVTPQNNVVDVLEVHPRNKKQFNIAYTIASPGALGLENKPGQEKEQINLLYNIWKSAVDRFDTIVHCPLPAQEQALDILSLSRLE